MSDTLVKVEGLSKKFCKNLKRSMLYGMKDIVQGTLGRSPRSDYLRPSEFWALDDISFELKRGECLGLIGPNGSGKSTLLKIVNGIVTPDRGRITINGKIGALIEIGAGFHPMLTGRENIYINGSILGFSKKDIDDKFDEIVSFSELEDFINTPVKNYSAGMRVRLGFAIAAQMQPDILLIDEILAVGDALFQYRCLERLVSLKKNGSSLIIVTHNLHLIPSICDSTILILSGKSEGKMEVSRAINIYRKLIREQLLDGKNNISKIHEKNIRGPNNFLRSGKREHLSIISFRILDHAGNQCNSFSINDLLFIEIVIHVLTDTPNVGAAFVIKDATGVNVIGRTSHHNNVSLNLKKGQNYRFRFRCQNILKPAVYSLTVTANWLPVPGNIPLAIAEDQIDNASFIESCSTPGFDVYARVHLPVHCESEELSRPLPDIEVFDESTTFIN